MFNFQWTAKPATFISHWQYDCRMLRHLYIRKDYVLFVETDVVKNARIDDKIQLINDTYIVNGTYMGDTRSGILLKDWEIQRR